MIRQTAHSLADIRADHKARYQFAIDIPDVQTVLDAGCGIGYGARMMIDAGRDVTAFDHHQPSIYDAWLYYGIDDPHCDTFANFKSVIEYDLVTMFEVIEHTPDALDFLKRVRAKRLVASVPNEVVVPFDPGRSNPEHYRHFTPDAFGIMLALAGWRVTWRGGQVGKHGADAMVTEGTARKRTLVYVAERIA